MKRAFGFFPLHQYRCIKEVKEFYSRLHHNLCHTKFIYLNLSRNQVIMGIAIFYVRRSCYRDVLYKKVVLKNFPKFTRKKLCQSLFFNKVAGWRIGWSWHRFFPVNFEKFLRTPFFKEHIRRLLMSDVNVFQVKSCLHLFILNHAFSITFWYFGRLKIILLF